MGAKIRTEAQRQDFANDTVEVVMKMNEEAGGDSKNWGFLAHPFEDHVILATTLAVVGTAGFMYIRGLNVKSFGTLLQSFGVKLSKLARTLKEIERKTFHLTGLGVVILYHVLTKNYGWTHADYTIFCWKTTAAIWWLDCFRVLFPEVLEYWPFTIMKNIIREKEKEQLSGTCYFSLGSTLAFAFFPPTIAITSIIYLVLGDMCAALIGVAFGGDACVVKMGREGNKSMEGSVAMFVVCIGVGYVAFWYIPMAEYPVVVSAFVATVVELYEPLGLNDNISIPLCTSLALSWAFERIKNC